MTDTLYITDLDGTLLHNNKRISERSAETLNDLIARGALISVASARSLIGIQMVNLSNVHFNVPLVLMNGVLLYDFAAGRILESCTWDDKTASSVLNICLTGGKPPLLYRVVDGKLDISFTKLTSVGEQIFCRDRAAVFPDSFHQVERFETAGAAYYSMQDRYDVLKPIRDKLALLPDVECVLYTDTYLANNWYLEIFSKRAGKGNGMKRLRERLHVKRVVAFGDNLNDLPLLKAADVACVVANGEKEARAAADFVIGSNEEDGVARFISEDYSKTEQSSRRHSSS